MAEPNLFVDGKPIGTIVDVRHLTVPIGPTIPSGPRISVPVVARGCAVLDRDGVQLALCPMPELAARLAYIINEHADV